MADLLTNPIRRSSGLLLAIAATAWLPTIALGVSTYSASVTAQTGVQNSTSPVVLSGLENLSFNRHGEGIVRAADTLSGHALASEGPRGFSNGIFETFNCNASASYDDIVIDGPVPGAQVNFTMHLPVRANFAQNYSAITFASFTDVSQPSNSIDCSGQLLTPFGFPGSRLVLSPILDQNDTFSFQLFGTVVPTGHPGPSSTESLPGGITIFHNVPLGSGGFLNLFNRTQIPITSSGTPFGAGAGLQFQDLVELRAELQISGTATVGQPFILNLVMSANSLAASSFDQSALASIDAIFSVPQDGSPVFDLPDGFTANSRSMGIVNNAVVPEPAAVAVAVGGACLTLTMRRLKHGRGATHNNRNQ